MLLFNFQKPLKRIVIEDIDSQVEGGGENSSTAVTSSALPVGHSGKAAVVDSRETQTPVATNAAESFTPARLSSTNSTVDPVSGGSGVESISTTENGRDLSPGSSVSRDSVEGKEDRVSVEVPVDADSLPVPQTSLQFQSQWKQLRKERSQLVAYFKVCPAFTCGEILSSYSPY